MEPILIPLSMSNIYLLPSRDGYLQIDTGYEWDYPAYRRQLVRKAIDIWEIKFLLLTHHHDDHAGFLPRLTEDSPLRIIAHRASANLLKGGVNDK